MSRPQSQLDQLDHVPVRGGHGPKLPIWPPSRALAQAILSRMDLASGELLLEYAPACGGTLGATAAWLRRHRTCRYLAIEPDPAVARVLRRHHPELTFHVGLCEDVFRILDHHDLPEPRAVLLPPGLYFQLEAWLERLLGVTAQVLGRRGRLWTVATEDGRNGPSLVQLDALLRPFFARRDCVAVVPGLPAAEVMLASA